MEHSLVTAKFCSAFYYQGFWRSLRQIDTGFNKLPRIECDGVGLIDLRMYQHISQILTLSIGRSIAQY